MGNDGGPSASGEGVERPGRPLDARFAALHDTLHELARQAIRSGPGRESIRPIELLNESYLRLARKPEGAPERRTEFIAFAATVLRNVLVDQARELATQKRGGTWERVTLQGRALAAPEPMDVLELEDALEQLGLLDERQVRIVELKFYGGLSIDEIATHLGVSPRTVDSEWALARAWLHRALSG
jgi:RNA polymerase sigma factor (TIGR02999 family)